MMNVNTNTSSGSYIREDGKMIGYNFYQSDRDDIESNPFYIRENFKKIFYGIQSKQDVIIAYFQTKKNAKTYLELLPKKEKYSIVELNFAD